MMMEPTRRQFDTIMTGNKKDDWHWNWCDALFMAPPVWTRLSKITGDDKYLQYMDYQYRKTYDSLWDGEENLFFRDKSYLDVKEKNGRKLFWSRGNGWVFGGLALMLPDMPEKWQGKEFYLDIFKKMAMVLKETQRQDGTWSSGILGNETDYPDKETSGTSFFAFGLAWGMNQGILDRATYEPVLWKAWSALEKSVTKNGMLGYVQPVGAAPGESFKDFTELYGTGAFLAAGSEVYQFLNKFYPAKKLKQQKSFTTLLENGGWCWYQDPRAVIKNGKVVIAGLDGQNGDVRIGVYNLDAAKNEGAITLHPKFEIDDHDVPALYARPDGKILAVWAKHGVEKLHYYALSTADNYLQWDSIQTFRHQFDYPAGVTYMNLFFLKNEGLLYNFFRDGQNFNPSFIVSKDHGNTWGQRTHFIANDISGRHRPYARYFQRNDSTIGISYTDGHPRDYGNSVYYAEFRNGTFYKADGAKIKSLETGPLHTSEGEKIYTGSETTAKPSGFESVPNSAWTCAIARDKNNNPHIGYTLYVNNNDHRFRIASWDGNKWNDREIAYAGNCLYLWESSYTGLMTFDPENPSKVYIATNVHPSTGKDLGGKHEIYAATISASDNIATIKWKAITGNSDVPNIRPLVVAGEGRKVLMWLRGPWHSYSNYDVDVVGKVVQ